MTVHTIMTSDESGEELVTFAQQTAHALVGNSLGRNQIRTIFTEVRQIEAGWGQDKAAALRRLTMLKPKLAYQTARTPSMDLLKKVLSEAIDEVVKVKEEEKRDQAFNRFMDLFEAILAYHRSEGGRN